MAEQHTCRHMMDSPLQLLRSAAERVEEYCGLWREQGAAWCMPLLQTAVPPLPPHGHWSAPPRTDEALLRKTLWPAATAAGLECDIRLWHGVTLHGAAARRRLLAPTERYLLVTFSRASDPMTPPADCQQCVPPSPRTLTIVVGLEGLPQEERNAWKRYVRREPSSPGEYVPRLLWSTLVRTEPWNHLFAAGWRVLYVAGPPVSRQQALDDIMAHCALYLWQAQLVERADVASWLQGYIRRVCPTVSQHEADYLLEVCKAFALPLHAHSLRVSLKDERAKNRRAEAVNPRLVWEIDLGATEAGETAQDARYHRPQRRRRSTQRGDASALSPREFAIMTGLKSYQVKYRISTGQITVTRRGRHLYAEADAASRLIRQEQITALTKELQRLRVLWKMLEHTAVGVEGAAPRAWDAARKWLKEQQKKQRTPAEVYAMIAAAPAIQGRCQQESALLSRAQTLLDQLGSQVPWRTEPLEGQQDGPR